MTLHNIPYEKVGKNEPVSIADDVPFEIPDSWEWVRLKSLGAPVDDAFADGPFGSNLKKEHYTEEQEVRLIQLSNIGDEGWKDANTKYTTYMHAQTLSRSMVKPGCIVIAKMMPAGRAIIVPDLEKDYILSSDAVKFIPNERLDVEYLLFAINSPAFRNQVVAEAHGVTRVRTSLGKLQTYYLPIPPLKEQKKIVQQIKNIYPLIKKYESGESKRLELDSLFPDLLKKSILQEAVMGKLVPQDPNDEPASVLLEKIRAEKQRLIAEGKLKKDKHESIIYRRDNSHYEKIDGEEKCIDDELSFDIPESWALIRLNDIGEYRKGPFGSSLTKSMFVPKSNKSIKVYEQKNAIQKNHTLGEYYIKKEYYDEKMTGFTVLPGDIIVSCAGTIGETYIMPENIELGIINQALMRMRIFAPINIDYFLLYFDYVIKQEAREHSKGSAIKNIPPFDIFKKIIFPLPPLEEQQRIVDAVNNLMERCNHL